MTKDSYFEMCEMLGTEPKEEEIPVEFEDLLEDVQEAFIVYNMLQDNWDTMNGNYMGKILSGIADILNIAGVQDQKTCFQLIQLIDRERSKIFSAKLKSKQNQKPAKK